jgi:hypothetical protein
MRVFQYPMSPITFELFEKGEIPGEISHGKYFHRVIKGNPKFPATRMPDETLAPASAQQSTQTGGKQHGPSTRKKSRRNSAHLEETPDA